MSQAEFVLVNTNNLRPPVSPVGLEYVAETLLNAGVPVRVLDLAFEPDWKAALRRCLAGDDSLAVALSVRNTDDCCFATRKSFLPWIREVVGEVRNLTPAPVFLGGVGFSIMPEAVLTAVGADGGIEGDGEEAVLALAEALAEGRDFTGLPGMVYRRDGVVVRNTRSDTDLRVLPLPRRRTFDNRQYERLGAMVGVETKRGCSQRCIFCADPLAKGTRVRLRPPETVAREFADLVEQGITWFHLGDSEFNYPLEHAKEVCRAIIGAGLGGKIRWYGYCSPVPFDRNLVRLMKAAGCAGINFGVDSLNDGQLQRLGRAHRVADVSQLTHLLHSESVNYIFDLLFGGPGETSETVASTIDEVRRLDVPLVGISAGVRVYPGTALDQAIKAGRILTGIHADAQDTGGPVFYSSPAIDNLAGLVDDLVGGDPRFLFLSSPAGRQSYNYAGDEELCLWIERGARGAFWDIIRQRR